MLNLFSIFDPSSFKSLQLNWIFMFIPLLIFPLLFWICLTRNSTLWKSMFKYLMTEMIMVKSFKHLLILVSLFFMIMINNLYGLFSYIFTSTSHISFNLAIVIPMWLNFMIMGWTFNSNHMFIHQLPVGTPYALMPFMVLIELISNLIRPITLSVRLTANMISGHLLLTLMSNNCPKNINLMNIIVVSSQTILVSLEISVALIQAYVMMILISIYSSEI